MGGRDALLLIKEQKTRSILCGHKFNATLKNFKNLL